MVELVFNAIHGERFQSCETQIFKNIDGKIKFLLKFPIRNTQYATTDDWFAYIMVARIDFDFAKNSDGDQLIGL